MKEIILVDLNGRVVFHKNVEQCESVDFYLDDRIIPGMYIVNLKTTEGIRYSKFILR